MLDTLVFSVNAVAPLTLLMAVGVLLRRCGMLDERFFLSANRLTFSLLLPVVLFCNIYDCRDAVENFDWTYVGLGIGCIFATFLALMICIPRICTDKTRIGTIVQAIYRSNFLVFGIPVVSNMFGEGELWTTSMLMPFAIPLFNILAVTALTWFVTPERGLKRVLNAALGILKNPLIIASLLSYAVIFLHITLPTAVYKTVSNLKGMGSPLALLALGGTLEFSSMKKNARALVSIGIGKLIVMPALMLAAGILAGYRGSSVGALLALGGSPVAISSYVMAQQCGSDADLAGQAVVVTTIASVLTMFCWIFGLRAAGIL